MVTNFNIVQVPSDIQTEEEIREFYEIVARNFQILKSRLDSGDEEFISAIARRSVGTVTAVPTGALFQWTTDTAPSGWALCDGQAVSRTGFSGLFAVIGETYGVGDGSTTFNLPDLRGRVPLGKDNMGGTSADRVTAAAADALGGAAGAEDHTLTIAEMPAHTHTESVGDDTGAGAKIRNTSNRLPLNTGSTGGGDPHSNMQPYQTFNYIVKT